MSVVDSSDYSVTFARGFYSRSNDSMDISSYSTTFSTGYNTTYSKYDCYPVFSIKITGSDLGTIGDNISLYMDSLQFSVFNDFGLDTQKRYYVLRNSLSPLKSYATFKYTGTGTIGNTHSSGWTGTTTTSIPFPFQPSDITQNRFYLQMNSNLTLPDVPINDWTNTGTTGKPEEVYNSTLKEIKLYFVFNLNQNWITSSDDIPWLPPEVDSPFRFYSYRNGVNFLFTHEEVPNSDNGLSNLGGQIQSSISAVSQSISTQATEIKQSINLMGESIKSEVSTMSDNITSGITTQTTEIKTTINSFKTSMQNKLDAVKTSVTQVKDSIVDLPNKLEEKAISLVVPDEETINSKYSEFEVLLSGRFGLIYQSADIIHDFADSFQTQAVMTADTGGIITMPQVTVSLAGTPFTFGGYEVDIIPDGFETLQQMCRLAVSMVCTVVFINMLKSKLEWILR